MTEIARFEGVPPNMSVSRTAPSPVSTSAIWRRMSWRRCFHVVVGTDAHRGDLGLRADDVLERGDKLRCEPPMGHQNHSDHGSPLMGREPPFSR